MRSASSKVLKLMFDKDLRRIEQMRAASSGKLRVLFVGFSDVRGGAAIASSRLIARLTNDCDVAPLEIVSQQRAGAPWTISQEFTFSHLRYLRTFIALRNVLVSDPYGWLPLERAFLRRVLALWQPDIIHLHNLHGGRGTIPLSILPEMAAVAPIVWTMHDMWGMTGHCAYSMGCNRWRDGCGGCPDLALYPRLLSDRTKHIAYNKSEILAKANPVLVSPSRWLSDLALEAKPTKSCEIQLIANGVDLTVFSPKFRAIAREELNLSSDSQVIMFAAESLDGDKRKGGAELRRALERVQTSRGGALLDVILMGRGGIDLLSGIPGIVVHHVGYVSDQAVAAKLYSAADVFICPSLQDNLPNALIEAAACGTAAVAFNVGGCGEIIDNEVSGLLVPGGDSAALGDAIERLVSEPERLAGMGRAARARAELLYSDTKMAYSYLSLYHELILRSNM